jgi:hypothetical protein
LDLQQQRIQNRVAAAQLTSGLGDDKRAADDLIKFWQNQVKHAQGIEKERARSNLISARLARQGLDNQGEQAGAGMSTIDFLKISQSIFRDFAGNLLPTGGPEAAKALFAPTAGVPGIADSASMAQQTDVDQLNELRQIRFLLERNGSGATVHVSQSFRQPDGTGYAQARYARLAMEDAFNG